MVIAKIRLEDSEEEEFIIGLSVESLQQLVSSACNINLVAVGGSHNIKIMAGLTDHDILDEIKSMSVPEVTH